MNKEQIEGKLDQVAGTVKQKTGEVFGDQKLANSGVAEQVKGAAKETWGKAKDAAAERRDVEADRTDASKEGLKLRTEDKLDAARDKVVNTAHNLKENISEKIDSFREQTHRG